MQMGGKWECDFMKMILGETGFYQSVSGGL